MQYRAQKKSAPKSRGASLDLKFRSRAVGPVIVVGQLDDAPDDESEDDRADDINAVAAPIEAALARGACARARGWALCQAQRLSRLRHRGTAGGDQRDGSDRGQFLREHGSLPFWIARRPCRAFDSAAGR